MCEWIDYILIIMMVVTNNLAKRIAKGTYQSTVLQRTILNKRIALNLTKNDNEKIINYVHRTKLNQSKFDICFHVPNHYNMSCYVYVIDRL